MNNDMARTYAEPLTLSVRQASHDLQWDGEGFALSSGALKSRTLKIEDDGDATELWRKKQDNALHEYQDSHVQEQISFSTHAIYKLFGAYIGSVLHGLNKESRPNVLDVGCGIGRRRPMYMRKLIDGVNYFGMDAFDINTDRDYPFICARLETFSSIDTFQNKFDVFIFGTSLDHFENLDEVAGAVKKLAAPGAVVVFWIGLHDATYVASEEGARVFRDIFDGAGPLAVAWRFLRFVVWDFPRIAYVLRRRSIKLKRGDKLDDLHFWYFMEKNIPEVLARFGEIIDISSVPGSNSVFATCRVGMDGTP